MTAPALSIRVGGHRYPVVLPSRRDPRLHVAMVIISIHVLGQVGLGFHVSVPQILAAILAAAIIEVVVTLRRTGHLEWPASALLTGSGVALIFRVLGTEAGDHWSAQDWHLFALVAAGSLATKYAIRYRGTPLFNPSNVGLVVAFLILGSSRVEPLDFWWGPLDVWMGLAYAVILGGGVLIAARLRMLPIVAGFWGTFTAAIGLLAASGHCFTARWSFEPVCDGHFWWVLATSPEVLVFMFFMLTDPRTIPGGRVARVAFGMFVAVVATILIAPQTTEFGAKVALLGSLVLLTGARPLLERVSAANRLPRYERGVIGAAVLVAVVVTIVVAGAPARLPVVAGASEVAAEPPGPAAAVTVDLAALPAVTADPEVARLDVDLAGAGAQQVAEGLATALAAESQALLAGDPAALVGVDAWARLDAMKAQLAEAAATGLTTISTYAFDSLHLVVTYPYGPQGGAAPGIRAHGTAEDVTIETTGEVVAREERDVAILFSMRRLQDGWMIVDAVPID